MFAGFLLQLRAHGVRVGTGEWLAFLDALRRGLATSPAALHRLGRALLCRSEAEFDAYDLAFAAAFAGAEVTPELAERLRQWLSTAAVAGDRPWQDPDVADEDLWRELADRLARQRDRHDGGDTWIGTGGTSPFGHAGRATRGIRIGGAGGARSAVQVVRDRAWEAYRTDRRLESRDLQLALRALRRLVREGEPELDLDGTVARTCANGGEIELVERRARNDQVRVVLLLDAGGSMAPHAARVEELFTAASAMRTFRSFEAWHFHNCVYGWLWREDRGIERRPVHEVLAALTPRHRLIFVGDAAMAPYELFGPLGYGQSGPTGIDQLRRFRERCPASVWLNPDPPAMWRHPTVEAIGRVFPMFELTLDGVRDAVKRLRAPV